MYLSVFCVSDCLDLVCCTSEDIYRRNGDTSCSLSRLSSVTPFSELFRSVTLTGIHSPLSVNKMIIFREMKSGASLSSTCFVHSHKFICLSKRAVVATFMYVCLFLCLFYLYGIYRPLQKSEQCCTSCLPVFDFKVWSWYFHLFFSCCTGSLSSKG